MPVALNKGFALGCRILLWMEFLSEAVHLPGLPLYANQSAQRMAVPSHYSTTLEYNQLEEIPGT